MTVSHKKKTAGEDLKRANKLSGGVPGGGGGSITDVRGLFNVFTDSGVP